MSAIEIPFGNSYIKLECEDSDKILSLAESVKNRMNNIKESYGNINDTKALFIISLMMQDEINTLSSKCIIAEEDIDQKEKLESLNEYLIEVIEHVSEYIEKLERTLKQQTNTPKINHNL